MRVEELHLKNFRCFKELDIQFPESNLAVFIGLNGAGKSAILDAISLLLSLWTQVGILRVGKNLTGEIFSNDDINLDSNNVKGYVKISYGSNNFSWDISKKRDDLSIIDNVSPSPFSAEYLLALVQEPNFTILKYTSNRKKIFSHEFSVGVGISSFNGFKSWFKKEEAKENRLQREKRDFDVTNPRLNIIRKTIEKFCNEISNMPIFDLRVRDITPNTTDLIINFGDNALTLNQLSDGQKNLLLLFVDIASSLIDNERSKNSLDWNENPDEILQRNGIVLIDEIELHLHPQWQREVLPALQKTFPNIQFIVTTHSPQVLSNLKKEEVFILKDNKIVEVTPHIEGRDSNSILSELFGVDERPERFKKQLKQLHNAIDDENLSEAKKILAELTTAFGEQDTEIVRANLHLSFAEE